MRMVETKKTEILQITTSPNKITIIGRIKGFWKFYGL
jgi:hypothetical protein